MFALIAAVVLAAPANPWLAEARTLVEALRFSEAIERLEVAAQVKGQPLDERREVYELLAYCQIAEGRRDAARTAFMTLLRDEPTLEPSSSSPKVREVFEEAKQALFPPDYVQLEERPSAVGSVQLRVVDPWRRVTQVMLVERRNGQAWVERALQPDGSIVRFKLEVASGERVEWYVEARDGDAPIAHLASADQPRAVAVAQVESVPPLEPKAGLSGRRVGGIVTMSVGVAMLAVATGLAVNGWSLRQAARDPSRPPGDFASTARESEDEGRREQTWSTGLFIGGGLIVGTGVVLAW